MEVSGHHFIQGMDQFMYGFEKMPGNNDGKQKGNNEHSDHHAKGSQETGGPVWTSPVWMDKNVKNTVMGSPMAKGRETAAINVIHNLKFFIR